jgi:tRNA(Ile)-lysidine synthetase-like protein
VSNPVEAVQELAAGSWLLAVSGGRDSMVLLDAMWTARRREIAAVLTFDHGTGTAASAAADHVELTCRRLELTCIRGQGKLAGRPTEDALRKARWEFLNKVALRLNSRIVTAHTLDDHAETTFIRILRDAGARGLAGMLVPSAVVRPFLLVGRNENAAYAETNDVTWVEDPSNRSMEYLRNRVRHEILPTIEKLRPGFTQWLHVTSARGAVWRRGLSDAVDHMCAGVPPGTLPVSMLEGLSKEAAAVVWPEVASRVGLTLDWRGIERLVNEAPKLKRNGEIQLSGGASLVRTVTTLVFRNPRGGGPLY